MSMQVQQSVTYLNPRASTIENVICMADYGAVKTEQLAKLEIKPHYILSKLFASAINYWKKDQRRKAFSEECAIIKSVYKRVENFFIYERVRRENFFLKSIQVDRFYREDRLDWIKDQDKAKNWQEIAWASNIVAMDPTGFPVELEGAWKTLKNACVKYLDPNGPDQPYVNAQYVYYGEYFDYYVLNNERWPPNE